MKRKPILVLKTGEALPPVKACFGDFETWITRGLDCAPREVAVAAVYRGEALPSSDAIAGVVVTGSPEMVTDRADWSEASGEWLARIVEEDAVPVLGLCYGHQLIAHGLGGEVGANPNGREMGTVEVRFSTDAGGEPLFEAGVHVGHMSHVESVLRPPEGAQILARTAVEPHAALRFGPRQWGVQFHPEFNREIMCGYVEARREILTSEGFDPDAIVAASVEAPGLTRVLARFARLVDAAAGG